MSVGEGGGGQGAQRSIMFVLCGQPSVCLKLGLLFLFCSFPFWCGGGGGEREMDPYVARCRNEIEEIYLGGSSFS